jgi:hypothetical protein
VRGDQRAVGGDEALVLGRQLLPVGSTIAQLRAEQLRARTGVLAWDCSWPWAAALSSAKDCISAQVDSYRDSSRFCSNSDWSRSACQAASLAAAAAWAASSRSSSARFDASRSEPWLLSGQRLLVRRLHLGQ